MTLQQQTLLPGQDLKPLTVYRGGSHASRTALQESVKRLLTSVIYGRNTGESLAKLSPDGLWLKTYQGFFQAKMDGSFEEYFGTLPTWGLMLDGQLFQPQALEPYIDESGWVLLPTPTKTDMNPGLKVCLRKDETWEDVSGTSSRMVGLKLKLTGRQKLPRKRLSIRPNFFAWMMGYPQNWTKLDATEMP